MHPATAYALFMGLFGLAGGFTATMYSPYLISIGLDIGQIALINTIFFGVISLMELPTGMWADGKSRLWSVRLGVLTLAASFALYSTATGFWTAAIWEAVGGIGTAFLSGAQQAWMTDALRNRGESASLRRVFGTSSAMNMAGLLVGGVASGWIASTFGFASCWLVGAGTLFITFLVSLAFMSDEGEPERRVKEWQAMKESCAALRSNRSLIWAVAACTAIGLVTPYNYGWSPFFQERVGTSALGYVWVPTYAAVALAGLAVRRLKGGFRIEGVGIPVAMFLAGGGMALAGLFPGFVLPLILAMIHEFGRGLFAPLADAFTQGHVESHYRATFGSLQSLISRAGFVFVLVAVWALTRFTGGNASSVPAIWLVAGTILAATSAVFWLLRPRHDRRTDRTVP